MLNDLRIKQPLKYFNWFFCGRSINNFPSWLIYWILVNMWNAEGRLNPMLTF